MHDPPVAGAVALHVDGADGDTVRALLGEPTNWCSADAS